ncbi:FAD-dependent monooxygenase [Mycobacterium sp. 21AC1]|uniref:FAD-dependent oxidoreductase n=1 Tax=[Mycobacterium] appelbergii TaxID=2939269 RepID=UPI002938F2A1|nr:NAD(P)/FAD-dependent oxidoreductase [Mycobacterium sp. 21AC1]MDV3125039.1 FAD-dependent monooxygenase [Mycobacterium sp. 21AC1]
MFTPENVADQYERAAADDLRILVVGAGIAGVTVAQLLRADGRHPVLIERSSDGGHPGYMLALMPMVDRALDDLGVRDSYRAASVALDRYGLRSHTGRMLRVDPMEALLDRFGDYRGIARGALIDVLSGTDCAVTCYSTLTALTEQSGVTQVQVTTAGVTREFEFDLVIIADGIRSSTRDLVLGGHRVGETDTGWAGWVAWAPTDTDPQLGEELWGAGFFVGTYPVLEQIGVFVGGPRADMTVGPAAYADRIRRELKTVAPRVDIALRAVAEDPDPYFWSLTDCRAPEWHNGHTVLLGDAAAGFLPTAGIGAGMAMQSAWVLSRLLRRAPTTPLDELLPAYEAMQRPRVAAAQDNSRRLAKIMFRRSSGLAVLRDLAMRTASVESVLGPIQRLLSEQPDPEAAWAGRAEYPRG